MNKHHKGTVKSITTLAKDIYKVAIILETMPQIKAGQFLNVKVPNNNFVLRRPFGISGFDTKTKIVEFCFQVRGDGTKALAKITQGTELDLLLPLGNGFPVDQYKKVMIIGGGIGIFPLLPVAKDNYAFLGFKNKDSVILKHEFSQIAKELTVVTEGFVTDTARREFDRIKPDAIFACGPHAMFKALKESFADTNTPIYISMEERMACGFGVCICCTTKTINETGETKQKRVCCDGPVFLLNEVIL